MTFKIDGYEPRVALISSMERCRKPKRKCTVSTAFAFGIACYFLGMAVGYLWHMMAVIK